MKKLSAFFFLSLLLISTFGYGVLAAPAGTGGSNLYDIVSSIVDKILSVGSLEFLLGADADSKFFGFIRISLGVLIFSVLYMGLSVIPHMSRHIAITVGVILAIISAVFTPVSVLAALGTTYATIFACLFIGGPIVAVLALLFATPTPSRVIAGIKIVVLSMLLILVNEISNWAIVLANAHP